MGNLLVWINQACTNYMALYKLIQSTIYFELLQMKVLILQKKCCTDLCLKAHSINEINKY